MTINDWLRGTWVHIAFDAAVRLFFGKTTVLLHLQDGVFSCQVA